MFEEIFLGLLPECCKIFLGGGRGARGVWVSGWNRSNGDASDQTGMSVCARDENGDLGFLESLCTLLYFKCERLLGTPQVSPSVLGPADDHRSSDPNSSGP